MVQSATLCNGPRQEAIELAHFKVTHFFLKLGMIMAYHVRVSVPSVINLEQNYGIS